VFLPTIQVKHCTCTATRHRKAGHEEPARFRRGCLRSAPGEIYPRLTTCLKPHARIVQARAMMTKKRRARQRWQPHQQRRQGGLRIAIYRKGSTAVSVFPVNNCCRDHILSVELREYSSRKVVVRFAPPVETPDVG
jgi:hypothetical protein